MPDNHYFAKKQREYTARDKKLGITRLGVRVPKSYRDQIQEIAKALREGNEVSYKIKKRKTVSD